MFQSVIETQSMRAGRFGTGAVISFAVHAGLILGVLWLTAPQVVVDPPELQLGPYKRPQPPKGTPKAAAQARPAAPKPRPKPKANAFAKPSPKPPEAVQPAPPSVVNTNDTKPGDGREGDPNGVEKDGTIGAVYVPDAAVGPPTGEEVLPMDAGMTRPRLLAGPELRYTQEALAARVEGTMVVKCVITREGDAQDCRVLKGLPHLSESVRQALEARHYTPVTFQGRPVSVSYTFNVRMELPQ